METQLLDKMGNEIKVPPRFSGDAKRFAALVSSLEPHHCAFPTGYPLHPDSGEPCRCKKTSEGVCRLHSENLLPRVINDAPSGRIRDGLISAFKDSRLTDTRPNIAIEEFLLSERMKMIENGESRRFIEYVESATSRLRDLFDAMKAAISAGDQEEFANLMKKLDRAITSINKVVDNRHKHHSALRELSDANGSSIRMKETASRIAINERQVISFDTAVITMREMVDLFHLAVNSVVTSKQERNEVYQKLSHSMYSIAGRLKPETQ